MAQKLLQQQLKDVGSKLENPPASKDLLIKLLKQAANYLSELGQSLLPSMMEAVRPCVNAIVKPELLKYHDRDVEVLVATCVCEITRITAPEAPYSDEVLRDIFQLFVVVFSGLNDINSPSFGRRVVILETLARFKSCVMMLDLECVDLIDKMFKTFFAVVSGDHPESVITSMQTIMILIIEESEDVPESLLFSLLSNLGGKRSDVSMAARRLAMNVIKNCAEKLEIYIKQFLVSSISGDITASSNLLDYHEVIFDIYQCAPRILFGVIPYITGELLTDQLDVRLKAVKLLGDMFALPGISISESFQPLFFEFLKRLSDRVVEVRISVAEHVKNCLLSNTSRSEAPDIITALSDRLLDYDENVRKEVVAAMFSVAYHSSTSIPSATMRLVAKRLRDKSVSVKRYTMERLAELYKRYCEKNPDVSVNGNDFEWIPGKIMRCVYDKDFRSETIEDILCCYLFPPAFSMKDKLNHWVAIFSRLDKVEVKALELLLFQKQRLQQQLQKYLSLRQTNEDADAPELQKRILGCFRTMSRLFNEPTKAEDNLHTLNQLKDAKIWKIMTCLLDPSTSFYQASTSRDELLRILGEKHPLYDFMSTLSIRCSYLLFNKELVKEILSEAATQKSSGNTNLLPCMNLLAVLACFFPMLLSGFEEDLVCLLKEDSEILKEGIAHVLAKAGGTIQEQLAMTSSSVDLLLERLCLEGSRKQAKYSVQALAAITKDDGLKALSVLYKRLVDMLGEKTHLPAILQSLGCIAQNAMPVFETKEGEIVEFITNKILECSNDDSAAKEKPDWNARSKICQLKIFGIKTLVKSYLPLKDAHLRVGIEKLLETLENILLFGEISNKIKSSPVDKAHLKLAAAKSILRLSKQWDHKIPVDIFYLTLSVSQNAYHEARKLFKSKVHQYIKERSLDAKYACAFLYNITESHPPEAEEDKHNLIEILQMLHQLRARQLSVQSDMNPFLAYPEYILPYLLHALVHHPYFPSVEDSENVQAFETIYWQLHLFLSTLLQGDEGWQPANARVKESFSILVSIFHSIKCSEDIADETKTKGSQALCDLGLLIAKRLLKGEGNSKDQIISVPLPPLLYKSIESIERNSSDTLLADDEKSWLGSKALTYFESLEVDKKMDATARNDGEIPKDSDTDGNEVPLGIIMKNLKAKGAKKKKGVKKQTEEMKNPNFDVDVLRMVREINLGNQEREESIKINETCEDNKNTLSVKKNRNMVIGLASVLTPKRKRSPFVPKFNSKSQRSSESISLPSLKAKEMFGHRILEHSLDEEKVSSTDSDLLVSCLPTDKPFASGNKKKGNSQILNGRPHVGKANTNLKDSTQHIKNEMKNGTSVLSSAQARKRKLKSIAGLAKCSEKLPKSGAELVGCRIKVWWPMDKQFYEGKVQSYDEGKKKHVVLYDDGDMEVLWLEKEKWKLVSNDNTSRKKQKFQALSEELSPEEDDINTKDDIRRKKKFINKTPSSSARRKTSGNKRHSQSRKSERKSDTASIAAENRDNLNASDLDIHAASETDDAKSDGSREKHRQLPGGGEKIEQGLLEVLKDPGEDHNSSSSDKILEGGEKSDQGAVKGLEELGEEEKHDSSSGGDEENSDDEPLNTWRQRAGK